MSDNRTLKPTAKRRQEARREGRVAASSSLVGGICWLGLAALGSLYGAQVVLGVRQAVVSFWSQPLRLADDSSSAAIHGVAMQLALSLGGLLCFILAIAVLGRFAQVGILWAPSRVMPQADRIAPGARLEDLFSWDRFVQAIRAAMVFGILLSVLLASLWYARETLSEYAVSPDVGMATLQLLTRWGLRIGLCLFGIGMLDYVYQRHRFEVSLQMTPEQLRSEIQAVQGNPQIGAGRRELRQAIQSERASMDGREALRHHD